ncbi:O-antigen ligase family protein [Lichenicola sp.]|uniref:O-antigen ligase family protein n=1 Tax=Lichenicola sp. TaxID=2804529 RepID=UPI003B009879
MIRLLDRLCLIATMLCVIFLVHGRGLAEATIDVVAIGFLVRSGLSGEWRWTATPWVPIALIWWGWLTICSLPVGPFGTGGWPGFVQAAATLRFLLFVAALQHSVLEGPRARRLVGWLLAVACLYIAAQMLLQDVTGRNLFGNPRFHDGTLTGPYDKPRAAAPLSRLLLPTMLVASAWIAGGAWLRGRSVKPAFRSLLAAASVLPLLAGLAMMVLAGQRMPMLLTLLGLVVAGLLLRRLRGPLLAALVAAPLLVAVSAVLSPRSFSHLVVLFARQMRDFPHSSYGLIYNRALAIGLANPMTGLGFDGFRNGCPDPAYFHAWPPWGDAEGDGGGVAICVQHAHNHALQALTDSGVVGLALFWAMVIAWLIALSRGLASRGQVPLHQAYRVGLFAAVFIHEWPIASASAFTNMPLGGWFFLILGVGLAEVSPPAPGHATPRPYMQPTLESEARDG